MTNDIHIRPAKSEDMNILLAFEQEIIGAERPFDATIRKTPISYYDLKALHGGTDAQIIVACDGEKIVSCGYALKREAKHYLDHSHYAYLGFMFTLPEYRGKGINAMIIDTLKKWAFSQGLTEVRLTVYNDNIPALRAYEKVGFKRHLIEMRMRMEE